MQHVLRCADVQIAFDLGHGGRAIRWLVGDHELLGGRGVHPVECGMYPMAPWAGRLRKNKVQLDDNQSITLPANYQGWAIHGTALAEPCEWTGTDSTLTWHQPLPATWPWDGEVRASLALTETEGGTELRTELSVRAIGHPGKALVGWHPWFRRVVNGTPARWRAPNAQLLQRDEDGVPSQRRIPIPDHGIDDTLEVPGRAMYISWGDELSLEIASSHEWFVVFDELKDVLCVEPQSAPPNAVNVPVFDELTRTPITLTTTWTIRRGRQTR